MELSIHEDSEVASLRKVNKVLKYFFITLSILAIIPLVLTIVYANKKIQRQQEIIQKRQILNTLQHELQDQNFIYQFSDMNISTFQIGLEKNTTSKPIRVIELQQNSLEQFSYNIIPGVQALTLDNNPLTKFNNNYFPSLWNMSVMTGKLEEFSNNYLILIDNLKVNQNIDNFDNNTLSITKLKLNNTKSFVQNTLPGLTSLTLSDTSGCKIANNNLPLLSDFELDQITPQDSIQNFTLSNNTFGKITDWNRSCLTYNHGWIIQNNTFPLMTSFMMINQTNLYSISNNIFPELSQFILLGASKKIIYTRFVLNNNSFPKLVTMNLNSELCLQSFVDNRLPIARNLDLSFNTFQIFSNNTFLELQSLNMSHNLVLTNFDIKAPKLRVLDLIHNSISILDSIDAPLLETLNVSISSLSKVNLTLPSLKTLNLSFALIEELNISNGSKIQTADLQFNRMKQFKQQWYNLTELNLNNNKLKSLDVTKYKKLTKLSAANNHIVNLSLGNLTELKVLDLSINNLTHFSSDLFVQLPNLVILNLFNNHLTSANISIPSLGTLNLSSNVDLKIIDNIVAPILLSLDISHCAIETITGLKFENLFEFKFQANPIKTFSNNTFNISQMDTSYLSDLEVFENNQIDGYDTALQNPVPFVMTSMKLSKFQGNDLIFGKIQFTPITLTLKQISKNDLTVQNGLIKISSPNLKSFTQNNVRFCSQLIIANTSLTEFENNTIFNVTEINIGNTTLKTLNKNNIIKGAKFLILDGNHFADTVVNEIIEMQLKGIQKISLKNNLILNKTKAEAALQEAYPNTTIIM